MTTVERQAPANTTSPQQGDTAPEPVSADTAAADDTDFEPTIVRGRE